MFLHLSVILFTGRGVSVQRGLCHRVSVWGSLSGGGGHSLSRGSLQGSSVQGVSIQWGCLSKRGSLSRGVFVMETPQYGERAGGTHTNGIYSCLINTFKNRLNSCPQWATECTPAQAVDN